MKKKRSILANEPSLKDLEDICDVLNTEKQPEVTAELVRLVTAWEEAGRNLQKMMHSDFALWRDVQNAWEVKWLPTKTGGARIALFPSLPISKQQQRKDGVFEPTPEGHALILFHALTLGHWEKLCDRPCGRCGKYYIKTRMNQKSYCGRRCASLASAKFSTRTRLDRERMEKVDQARGAIQEWDALKRHPAIDWKQWVHKRKPDITLKWLTRAINDYEKYALDPPKKEHSKQRAV